MSIGNHVRLKQFDDKRQWGVILAVNEDQYQVEWKPYTMDINVYPARIQTYDVSELELTQNKPFLIHERVDYVHNGIYRPGRRIERYVTWDTVGLDDGSVVNTADIWRSGTLPPFDVNIN